MISKQSLRFWGRWKVWLCLSLMVWTVAAESTHNHPSQTEANSCSICVVAHTANPAPTSTHTTPIFAAVGVLQEQDAVVKTQFDLCDAGIRGPPATL
jgi:AhpD family alkylhydroperoxidase